jgi:H+/Cl- antiporter ClcA
VREQMINNTYWILLIISFLFISIIFGLISIVFYKIFSILKFRPPINQPNLHKGENTF